MKKAKWCWWALAVAAFVLAACSREEGESWLPNEDGQGGQAAADGEPLVPLGAGDKPGAHAAGVPTTALPFGCNSPVPKQCWLYRIPLAGNPTVDVTLRNKYIAAFGSACYMSVSNTFDCFYKEWEKACKDAVMIGGIYSPNAPYSMNYTCQPVGNGDYTLQIGPDIANQITINYQPAPRQTPKIDVNGVPTEVNGPYRNLADPAKVEPGQEFYCATQKKKILQENRNAHGGQIYSDLQGFMYPCVKEGVSTTCEEPIVLKDPDAKPAPPKNDPERAEVHHVVRKTDKRSCPWGTNSNKNAAVISARLNQYLYNKEPTAGEVTQINAVPPSPP